MKASQHIPLGSELIRLTRWAGHRAKIYPLLFYKFPISSMENFCRAARAEPIFLDPFE